MMRRLHERTLHLLHSRPTPMTIKLIADETGINIDWIRKFSSGKISDPSVNTVEHLYEFLTGRELDV